MSKTDSANLIHKAWDYIPVWFPGERVNLGDYGKIEEKCFQREGNIADLGLKFKPRPGNEQREEE